jgi:hypothetical protein
VSDGQGSDGKMRCPTCGKDNACGMANGAASCWCFAMPHVLPVSKADEAARCYCRACLAGVIAAQAASNCSRPIDPSRRGSRSGSASG